jgi:translation initiation factor 1
MNNNWKNRDGVVYSTNKEFEFDTNEPEAMQTLEPSKQNLKVFIDKKQRKGKSVTIVSGFVGTDDDFQTLAKALKTKCGAGGTAKYGEILIQGEFVDKVLDYLINAKYRAKRK